MVKKDAKEDDMDVDVEDDDEYTPEGGITIDDIYIPPPPPAACTNENTGSRLVITKIENSFFKSYAGNQVLGPFHKSFTSIVGPNGSGKSNVIDSMLFVFGKKSKQIRSKNLSVLIHNSNTHPNVPSCTVAVHFAEILDKGGDDFELVPDTTFVVSRTAFKDNKNYYEVDGKKTPFKEVGKLLRSKGIDLDHNRFLILQGEVENISLMKPKALSEHDTGMLEYLEDIVGTSRFKVPIETFAKRVEDLNEDRVEKLNRVKLVEKEKDDLEPAMKEALGFLELENERERKTHIKNQRFIMDAGVIVAKVTEEKEEIEASASDLTEKLKEATDARKNKEKELKEKGGEFDTVEKQMEASLETFKKLEKEDVGHKEDMKNTNTKRKKVKQLLSLEQEKKEKLEAVPEENKKKIEECVELRDQNKEKMEKEEENYATAMKTLSAETKQYQDDKEKYESQLIGLRKVVNETESVVTLAQNELTLYQSAEQKEKIHLDQLTNNIKKIKDTVKEKSARLNELTPLVPSKEKELKNKEKQFEDLAPKLEECENKLKGLRAEFKEKSSAQESAKSLGVIGDALMQQKTNGNIPGIIGRLGDLGAIDKKYDVAVSTAGGGALDNYIVHTVQDAKKCIEFLKQNNIGRGNFYALEKAKENYSHKAYSTIETPMNVPRVFDLIKVQDEALKPAFYHYFRDTLLATDMDQATKVGYGAQRFRVVTLGGETIETSGTMSGGGGRPASGKMGQQVANADKISPKEIKKMEEGIEETAAEEKDLRNQVQECEDLIYKLKNEIKDLKKQHSKLSVEVDPLKQQLTLMEERVADQQKKVKDATPDKAKVAEMTKKVDAAQKEHDKAAAPVDEIQHKVKEIDGKIKDITSTKIKPIQKKRDDATKNYEKMKTEVTRLEVETKTAVRTLKKCQDKVESYEAEIKDAEDSMRGMQTRRQVIEEEGKVILDETAKLKERSAELASIVKNLKTEADEINKQEQKWKSSRIEVDKNLEEKNVIIQNNKKKVQFWIRENKKITLQEIPGVDVEEIKELNEEELLEIDADAIAQELNLIIEQIAATKPNMAAIEEYKRKNKIYLERVTELDAMTLRRDEQRKHHDELRKQRFNDFMDGFGIITGKLKEMYQMITLGGDAELELVDSLDPFSEGIVFSVRPPKKSWKNISNLSGGEKTLSSLALVFALHYYKPTPLYVMDEIDAALDFKNVSIVANYIKERTKNAQFIIISLRSNMFELADRLVGIYKTYNTTKTVTINPYAINGIEMVLNQGSTQSTQGNPRPPSSSQPVLNGSQPSQNGSQASQPSQRPPGTLPFQETGPSQAKGLLNGMKDSHGQDDQNGVLEDLGLIENAMDVQN